VSCCVFWLSFSHI